MPPGIIDALESIDITNHNRKLLNLLLLDQLIQGLFISGIGVLVSYPCKGIRDCHMAEGPAGFLFLFQPASCHGSQLQQKNQGKQQDRHQRA